MRFWIWKVAGLPRVPTCTLQTAQLYDQSSRKQTRGLAVVVPRLSAWIFQAIAYHGLVSTDYFGHPTSSIVKQWQMSLCAETGLWTVVEPPTIARCSRRARVPLSGRITTTSEVG